MSIDGTDCSVNEPSKFSPEFYSHKFHHSAVRYELGVSLDGSIVWSNGPFPAGSFCDMRIFNSYLRKNLNNGERVIADRGYGGARCVTPRNTSSRYAARAMVYRANHERINGRIKRFRVLSTRFRHNLDKHRFCFHAVANVIQLEMQLHGK